MQAEGKTWCRQVSGEELWIPGRTDSPCSLLVVTCERKHADEDWTSGSNSDNSGDGKAEGSRNGDEKQLMNQEDIQETEPVEVSDKLGVGAEQEKNR